MFNWLYTYILKKAREYEQDQWIMAGAVTGLERYKSLFGEYPECVVDIGAHHGSLSKAALEHGALQVIAIEASKDNYKKLIQNLKDLPNQSNAICINNAFCENNGAKVRLISNKRGNSGQKSLVYVTNGIIKDYIFEECFPFDRSDLLKMFRHNDVIDYLKMDIEGGEFYALPFDNETKELLSRVRFLDIELHSLDNSRFFDKQCFLDTHLEYNSNKDMIQQFIDFLSECGFEKPPREIKKCPGMKLLTSNKRFYA